MSNVGPKGRSYLQITKDDLKRLAKLARSDMHDFFRRCPDWGKLYADRRICIALCQGAAQHYVDKQTGLKETGINDFDVYTFFKAHPRRRWYAKRRKSCALGDLKFGTSVDKPSWDGRRVDFWSRGIEVKGGEAPMAALRRWLREGKSESARRLRAKSVVLLTPNCGRVFWPVMDT